MKSKKSRYVHYLRSDLIRSRVDEERRKVRKVQVARGKSLR